MNSMEKTAQKLLEKAGVEINGRNPWDIQVHNPRFYSRVLSQGTLGLGESYMDGDWDCQALDQFFYRALKTELDKELRITLPLIKNAIKAKLINLQSPRRAFQIGERHYDTGNDLYQAMLDKRLAYTCAYWDNGATNLDDAQEAKLELVCKKIGLKEGEKVLDIGGGWGSFARYAAEQHGANVKATTVSKEQAELGRTLIKEARGVEIALEDYRDTKGKFDHVVSLGMFEHVGPRNYRTYMKKVSSLLEEDGLFLLHTIGSNKSSAVGDLWVSKYIFPNSKLPSQKQIAEAAEGLFIEEDSHNLSTNYDKTLMAWCRNISSNWNELSKEKYDERFRRMWEYYLLSCAGAFRARKIQVWQKVFSKKGLDNGYKSVR
ncbi:cyclopropane-fatty-acyl-phospholipid synthase [Candidatus Pacearchaeota archaeon CG10_big_fil_rev_8_21_14_0_10_31_9]|nr:MAG: cyclopropane-fatty-acyl-phospholipid synthase [Candidatus Pacearchaeota archaeon CG1_02_32_21]PIN92680.1 MAG: cyclopropane-fatty-acyl-phospholipid synthase [Candidatus Pacearchaeota archaeon CG10_big_fil_rev_8_21_14_0_10_31_9]PIZ83093.1 MAG: cyclopropane-fatty-acyl-phospholipid synthase [Candidatus Pacearchaeota archaeon CG_4_10_14_0_2_um_filter_05_32_18]